MTAPPPMSQPDPEWDELKRELTVASQQAAQSARVQLAHELNQLLRRFRQYEKEADWVRLVMEGAGNYSRQAALFAVQGDALILRGEANLELAADLRLDLKKTAAFEAVLRSKEPVTALRANGEVGAELASAGRLAYLFPILNGSRVVAILFASGEDSEVDQLEMVANVAAGALERQVNSGLHAQIVPAANKPEPVTIAPALPTSPEKQPAMLPPWAHLAPEHREMHSQAARFARVTVAHMQLLNPASCRAARDKGDLYVLLGKEIDKARETYRQRFMILPSMADYLHRELVGSILEGDSAKLGADYPGELA